VSRRDVGHINAFGIRDMYHGAQRRHFHLARHPGSNNRARPWLAQ
jgi:hypothetical protein